MFQSSVGVVRDCCKEILLSRVRFAKIKIHAANVYLKTGRGTFFFSLLYSCQIHRCPRCKVISSVRAGKSCHQQPDTQKCADGTSVSSPKQINHD